MSEDTGTAIAPVVCTLDPKQRVARGLEWSDLGPLALTSEQIDGGVASTYPLTMADAVIDLANRESSCCGSWLNVSTSEVDGAIRVELTTLNPEGLALITSIAGFSS